MSDILQNPLLDDAAISDERDVISEETEAVRKAYDVSIWDHLHETAFMGTGLSRTIRGPEENIRSMNRRELQSFISSQYSADRFVIAAAGAVDHKELLALTETHFGKLPNHPTGSLTLPFDAAIFTGSDKRIRFDSMGVRYFQYPNADDGRGWDWCQFIMFPSLSTLLHVQTWNITSGDAWSLLWDRTLRTYTNHHIVNLLFPYSLHTLP